MAIGKTSDPLVGRGRDGPCGPPCADPESRFPHLAPRSGHRGTYRWRLEGMTQGRPGLDESGAHHSSVALGNTGTTEVAEGILPRAAIGRPLTRTYDMVNGKAHQSWIIEQVRQ